MNNIQEILNANRVVPVVVLDRVEDTAPLCEAQTDAITRRTELAEVNRPTRATTAVIIFPKDSHV